MASWSIPADMQLHPKTLLFAVPLVQESSSTFGYEPCLPLAMSERPQRPQKENNLRAVEIGRLPRLGRNPALQSQSRNCGVCGGELPATDFSRLDGPQLVGTTIQLACKHLFHDQCIRGWTIVGVSLEVLRSMLELHDPKESFEVDLGVYRN